MTTPTNVLDVARAHLGEGESPPGSNHTSFGAWYGMNNVSWCAEFVSFCLVRGGFNDGADHIAIPGVAADTSKGWAYVPDIVGAAQRAGRFDRTPHSGDVVTYYWSGDGNPGDSHTGLVESVNADGSINTIEGNEQNVVERRTRPVDGVVKGFFHPPYATAPTPTPTQPTEDDMAEPGEAVDAVMNPDGTGWVLDRWGGIHSVGGAPKASGGPYWEGKDVARRLIVTDASKPSGYVLDMKGGVHPFGGAAPVKTVPGAPNPYWP